MKKLTLVLVSLALGACTYREEHTKFNPQPGPGLEWQKQSQAVERGSYETTEVILKSTLDQIIEPKCRKSPDLDVRVQSGRRAVRYTEEKIREDIPASMVIEEIDIGQTRASEYDAAYNKWHKASNAVFSRRETSGINIKKVDYDGFYFADVTTTSKERDAITAFPIVNESPIFRALYEKTVNAQESTRERSIGFFNFGNGTRTKAAAEIRVIKYENGDRIGIAAVWIPLATGIIDLACAPDFAYSAIFIIENGVITVKVENETLFTSAM